eukprot:10218805-Alexandrium_andersonii.AAC.1
MRLNKLAMFITNHRRSMQSAASASAAPPENVAGTGPSPSQSLPTIPEAPGAIPKAKAGAQ